jgi:hypothetical protein
MPNRAAFASDNLVKMFPVNDFLNPSGLMSTSTA